MIARAPDLSTIAENLRAIFPSLVQAASLRLLGVGFGSVVVETAGGIVFRVARSRAAAEGQAREARFLPALRARVSIAVPNPRWYAPPSARFPFGVIGYEKLPGAPLGPAAFVGLDQGRIAGDLGRFLGELHRFPVAEARALGLPRPDEEQEMLAAQWDRSRPTWRQVLTRREYRILSAWWESFLADSLMRQYPPAVVHGDLWYENVLLDEGTGAVAAVLDFENAAIGDPARDLATQLYLGESFAARVLDAHHAAGRAVDPSFLYRMRRHWELREAVVPDDPSELADQVRKLRNGPILRT